MRRVLSVAALCATAILSLTGCVSLTKSYPEKRSYVVDVGGASKEADVLAPRDEPSVLKINRLRVVPFFAGRAMVYRTAELQYESDYYNEWFVAPGSLLTQQFTAWLSGNGPFHVVLMGTNHIEPTHVLEGTVTEFYGDFRQSGQPKAVFAIDLHLLDGKDERRMLMRRSYRQEVPLNSASSDSLAQGLTQALRLVLGEFGRDIASIVASPSTSSAQK